ncbi:MAG: hypothetical protein HRU19_22645 [Pseudobacteriovorax sp.]|nr:hypothetical protein [Pseudobacteriovorax sp.]
MFKVAGIFVFFVIFVTLDLRAENLKDIWQKAHTLTPLEKPMLSPQDLKQARFGRKLFFDARMSFGGEISCASCHNPTNFFADGLPTSKGLSIGERNAPTVVNSFALERAFWDGRSDHIAAQALGPLENIAEHGTNRLQVVRHVESFYLKEYQSIFGDFPDIETNRSQAKPSFAQVSLTENLKRRFEDSSFFSFLKGTFSLAARRHAKPPKDAISWQQGYEALKPADKSRINQVFANIGIAISQYERTLTATRSPFDAFMANWTDPGEVPLSQNFDQGAFEGLKIFLGKGQCTNCHSGPNFTDNEFHNIGVISEFGDPGRVVGLRLAEDEGAFHCESEYYRAYPWLSNTDACEEKPYLDPDNPDNVGAFKTPSLRNVALTRPYFHNGSASSLHAVMQHYNELPDEPLPTGHLSQSLARVALNEEEIANVIKFMKSLSAPLEQPLDLDYQAN